MCLIVRPTYFAMNVKKIGVFGNHRLCKVMQRNDGSSKSPSNWLQVTSTLSNLCKQLHLQQFAPQKKTREDSAQNTALQKKTVNPHHSTKPCQSASKHFILGSASWAMWSSFHYLSWCLRCWSFGSFNRPCHGQAKKRWTSAGLIFFSVWRFGMNEMRCTMPSGDIFWVGWKF